MSDSKAYFEANKIRFFEELREWVAIPSISADPEHAAEVRRCAEWTLNHLITLGFDGELKEAKGHPIVWAEYKAGEDRPTVLFYGHYDVQPPDPIEEWESPAFELTERDKRWYGRGSQDDKGQVFYVLKAIEYLISNNALSVNVKVCLEGEEEVGSPSISHEAASWKDDLAADVLLVCDTHKVAGGNPTLSLGLRGISAFEVELKTSDRSLHSGIHGGKLANAGIELVKLLETLWDKEGRILVNDFYAEVDAPSEFMKEELLKHEPDRSEYLESVGAKTFFSEAGYEPEIACAFRPTIEINGITCGYQGPGSKTIIPHKASVKLSMRLVSKQDPDTIRARVEKHLVENCPEHAELSFPAGEHGGPPLSEDPNSEVVKTTIEALKSVSDLPVALAWSGASIPVVSGLAKIAGAAPILVGFGTEEGRIHEPNESFGIEDFREGFLFACEYFALLGK